MVDCPAPDDLVEPRVDRILTQYRESPKLLHVIRTYLRQAEQVVSAICAVPSFFDLDTAVGDQLTLLGKRLGFPRCHCICSVQPVFGFDCEGVPSGYPITGFCDDNQTWVDCGPFGTSDICITDDEVYRGFLRARRYQMLGLFDIESLTAAVQHLFGATAAVMDAGVGRVVIAPNRWLTTAEVALLQLYPRVLPVAPGIRVRFHIDADTTVFGFGDGWGGFCDRLVSLVDEHGNLIVDEFGNELAVTQSSQWLCEIDVHPYDCAV